MFLLSLTGDLNEFSITSSHGKNLARFFVKMYHPHDTLSPGLPPASENPCAGSLLLAFLLALWSSDSYQIYTLCSTYKHSRPSLEWNSELFYLLRTNQFQRSKNHALRCCHSSEAIFFVTFYFIYEGTCIYEFGYRSAIVYIHGR